LVHSGWNQPLRVKPSNEREDAQMPRFYISKRDGCERNLSLIARCIHPASHQPRDQPREEKSTSPATNISADNPFLDPAERSALRQMRTHATHSLPGHGPRRSRPDVLLGLRAKKFTKPYIVSRRLAVQWVSKKSLTVQQYGVRAMGSFMCDRATMTFLGSAL
jgi:hypothetical protein